MKLRDYVTALCIALCVVFALLSFSLYKNGVMYVQKIKWLQNENRRLSGNLHKYAELQPVISADALSALVEEYVQLRIENMAQQDYIEGFSEFMEDKYDFSGHQARWEDK